VAWSWSIAHLCGIVTRSFSALHSGDRGQADMGNIVVGEIFAEPTT
jgi:hypothetical protein